MAGKNSKNKKTIKPAEKKIGKSKQIGSDFVCNICGHFDPFHGALGSFEFLVKSEIVSDHPHGRLLCFILQ